MIAPLLVLDSAERWKPVSVDQSLAIHGYRWEQKTFRRRGEPVDRIDLPPGMTPDDFKDLPVVGYRRAVFGGRLYWQQYWLWYPYNPKSYAGRGQHEGDWELVQIGCKDMAGDEPVLMTCSQHGGGERRFYWDVVLSEGKTGRPLVYVARDSHANYFGPTRTVTDLVDGKGAELDAVTWLEFGAWAKWRGRWGNSANSPGPLSTRRAWQAPHAWHSQARG